MYETIRFLSPFLQAACDLSDIQCAAALIHSGEADSSSSTVDRATSMNPFPGSTRGYPKSEEELQRLEAEEEIRKKKKEALDEVEEGVEVDLEEGAGMIEAADLRELMDIAGLAEGDEEMQELVLEADYSDMEQYRDKLDADVASRATEIVTARAVRGSGYVAEKASLTLRDLARLEPCGVLAVCPSMKQKDVEHVGR
jgi:hypothetical protein